MAEGAGFALWAPLLVVVLAVFMFSLDMTMMNVAVSAIANDLGTEVSAVQAAIALYPLVMAALILTGAKIGDIRGARWTFLVGTGIFGVGTAVAALSPNIETLYFGWSFLEGIGAALFYPLAFVFIFLHYSGTRRIFAFGVVTALQAIGAAVGPIVGGALTTFASWRWGFGMEVFIVAAIIPLGIRYLRETPQDPEAKLDWVGTGLFATALLSIVIGVLLAPRYGWWDARRAFEIGGVAINPFGLSPVPLLIGLGLILLVTFVHWQRRRTRRGQEPLFQLEILRHRPYVLSTAVDALRALFFAGILFILPVFLLLLGGLSAFESGLSLLSITVSSLVASLTTAKLAKRFAPKYIVLGGLVLMAIGAFYFLFETTPTMDLTSTILPGIIFGLGAGVYYTQIINLQLSYVKDEERNQASGFRTMGTQVASSFGTALIGAILLAGIYANLVDGILREAGITLPPEERERLIVELEDAVAGMSQEEIDRVISQLPPDEQAALRALTGSAAVEAMQAAWLAIVALILIGLLLTTFLPATKLEDKSMATYAEPPADGAEVSE